MTTTDLATIERKLRAGMVLSSEQALELCKMTRAAAFALVEAELRALAHYGGCTEARVYNVDDDKIVNVALSHGPRKMADTLMQAVDALREATPKPGSEP